MKPQNSPALLMIYNSLLQRFGPRNWWPADTPFEMSVGAILTQNTSWTNVEYAIRNLKDYDKIDPEQLAAMPVELLEKLIRPSGYYRQKARRLQEFSRYLVTEYHGDVIQFCSGPLDKARARLLAIKGIGPETADSILLYAAAKPSFVVDAYTRRIFQRIGLLTGQETYEEVRNFFMRQLPWDVQLYNEYHAQIVILAKTYCTKRPHCLNCPLKEFCNFALEQELADNP